LDLPSEGEAGRRGSQFGEELLSDQKLKGCDIGYALAASSCEGAKQRGDMHHRSPRCDHCFRSSKPQLLLAEPSVFSGLVVRQVALPIPITQFTLGGHDLFWPTLSTVDGAQVKRRSEKCQCRFSVQCEFICGELRVSQLIEAMKVAREKNVWG